MRIGVGVLLALLGFGTMAQAQTALPVITVQEEAGFKQWITEFRAKALAAGIEPRVFDDAFAGVSLNARVIAADRKQAEFVRPIWEYLDSAVSESRIQQGRAKLRDMGDVLAQIEERYRVPAAVVLAIWGMETAYGARRGEIPVIEALATLAFEGRRAKWASEQLMLALKILQRGDIDVARMKGSWAGAMGHTQFIPSSFESYAVDFNGDGRRDVWNEEPSDALASTAHYLARHGWRMGEPWGIEVTLPKGFDRGAFRDTEEKTAAEWQRLGLTAVDGTAIPNVNGGALLQPAGARGPAFLVYHNFKVIKRYNNATAYAMGVGHLADRIMGGGAIRGTWPRADKPMTVAEVKEMQTLLGRLGFASGEPDGVIGPSTREAIRNWQLARGFVADGFATGSLIEGLRRADAGNNGLTLAEGKQLQEALIARGLMSGPADGLIGPGTMAAIARWQKIKGHTPDGRPSAALLQELTAATTATSPPPTPAPAAKPTLILQPERSDP